MKMKTILIFLSILLTLVIAGCNGNYGEHGELCVNCGCEAEPPEVEDIHRGQGLMESELRKDFFRNAESLVRAAVGEVGESGVPLREEDVEVVFTGITAIATVRGSRLSPVVVFLFYRPNLDNRTAREIIWEVTGYGAAFFDATDTVFMYPWPPYIIPAREPVQSRHLTNLATVTLPFYDWGHGLGITEEVIQGENLWEEAIRLTRLHYNVQIRDIWYNGRTLYVEMMPIMANSFNGGIGSTLHGDSVRRTFEAFPNVTDVRFLVLGRRFTIGYNGYDINCVYPCPGMRGMAGMEWESMDNPPEHTCMW